MELAFFPPRLIARGSLRRGNPGEGGIRFACGEADLSVPYRVYRGRFDRVDSVRLSRAELVLERSAGRPAAVVRAQPGVEAGCRHSP